MPIFSRKIAKANQQMATEKQEKKKQHTQTQSL